MKNNYLTHAQVDATAQKLKTCGADKDCREQALAEANRLSVSNDLRLLTCKSTNNCEQLQAEYRTGYRAIEGLLDSGISPNDIGRLFGMEDMAATMMRSGLSQKYCETPQCIERAQHLSGIAKGLLALHPVGLVAGAGAAGYLLTTEIIQTGVADTAIKVAQGIADLPAHVVAGLNSSDPSVRGEALVVALTFPAVVGAVTAKLGSAGLNVLTSKTEAAALRVGGVSELLKAGNALDKGGFTAVGRALQKHGSRTESIFPRATGNPAVINAQGEAVLNGILTNPNATSVIRHHGRFGNVLEYRIPSGQGARFSGDGKTFIGFLE